MYGYQVIARKRRRIKLKTTHQNSAWFSRYTTPPPPFPRAPSPWGDRGWKLNRCPKTYCGEQSEVLACLAGALHNAGTMCFQRSQRCQVGTIFMPRSSIRPPLHSDKQNLLQLLFYPPNLLLTYSGVEFGLNSPSYLLHLPTPHSSDRCRVTSVS